MALNIAVLMKILVSLTIFGPMNKLNCYPLERWIREPSEEKNRRKWL